MRKTTLLLSLLVLLAPTAARAQDGPSTTTAPATRSAAIPPAAEGAKQALNQSTRHGEWVDIALPGSETKLRTWVVYPERKEKAPVVLVIHEIFGLTDWVRAVADQLAADGFVAVAPDFLSGMGPNGGGTEALGDRVREEIRKLSPDDVAKRLDAARAWAIQQPAASDKTASIGFCWGGSASFNYAVRQPKLNGAVVYYGSGPKDKAELAKITCPVLGLYGGDDARVTGTVDATRQGMAEAQKTYDPHVFNRAGHGFLRQQSAKDGANDKASGEAWQLTVAFLKKHLQ